MTTAAGAAGGPGAPEDPPAQRFCWSDLWRGVPAAVWGTTAVLGLLLALASLLYPAYRGPDEPQHVGVAVALVEGEVTPLWTSGSLQFSPAVYAAGVLENVRLTEPLRLADRDATPRGQRLSHAQAQAQDDGGPRPPNHLVQHPPGYYLVLAGVLEVLPGWQSWDFDRVGAVLRLVSVLMVLPLPLVVHATARRASGSRPVATAAAAVVLCVPQLVHVGSVVNNDALTILTSALTVLLVVCVLGGDLSRRTAGWLGLVLGVALLSKGLALMLVPVVTAAYVLAAVRRRSPSALGPLVLVGVLSGLVGGWWWLRNLALYGTLQPDGHFPDGRKPAVETVLSWADGGATWLRSFVELFTYRFFFNDPTGLAPFGAAYVLAAGAALLGGLLVVVALVVGRSATTGGLRVGDRLVLVAPLPLFTAVVAAGSYEAFTLGRDEAAMQGRYAFGALCGLSVLLAVGASRLVPRHRHGLLPACVLVAAAVLQLLAVVSTLRAYWWSPDAGLAGTAAAFLDHSPWPPAVVLALLVATVVAVLVTAAAVRPSAVAPPAPRRDPLAAAAASEPALARQART